jgi:hypothetical protein
MPFYLPHNVHNLSFIERIPASKAAIGTNKEGPTLNSLLLTVAGSREESFPTDIPATSVAAVIMRLLRLPTNAISTIPEPQSTTVSHPAMAADEEVDSYFTCAATRTRRRFDAIAPTTTAVIVLGNGGGSNVVDTTRTQTTTACGGSSKHALLDPHSPTNQT